MVFLAATPCILAALDSLSPLELNSLNLPDSLALGSPVAHDQLIRLSQHLRASRGSGTDRTWTLNSLLTGTKVYSPPQPPKPEPSPEYLALKARLLAAAERDAYERMVRPAASTAPMLGLDSMSISDEGGPDQDAITPSLVLNIFLSVLITGFGVYWALTSFQTSSIYVPFISREKGGPAMSEPVRVLIALLSAVLAGAAESAIYAIYLGKISRARTKERDVQERKIVVQREIIRAGNGKAEGQEIWGRGINGGVRRRVRERWERETKG